MADVAEKLTEVVAEIAGKENSVLAENEEIKTESKVAVEVGDTGNISKLEKSIIRQVEYYFGDANLARDKFLVEQISKDGDGWVLFSVLLTFKRLSELSKDTDVIIKAMLKSEEGLVEISEDRTKIRRHPERPIPEQNEERRKEIMSRTAYAKGFPLDSEIAEIIEFFTPYDNVVNIAMRKYLDKPTKTYKFKGSVFVTFEKKEQTKEFIEKEKVVYKERELLRKWQEKYLEDKKEELKNKNSKKHNKNKAKAVEVENKIELPKGTVLCFEEAPETVTRELLREAFENIPGSWNIAYIDFSKGDKVGHIRLHDEDTATKLLETLEEKKLKLKDEVVLTLRTLADEEEKTFLEKAVEQMKSRRNQHKHKGGGHGNRKRKGGSHHYGGDKKKKVD